MEKGMKKKRVVVVVIDGFGIGYAPDADKYGDVGANTLESIVKANVKLDFLKKLGLYKAAGMECEGEIVGKYAKQREASAGKDTPVGHWEICGAITKNQLPTYPDGFPEEILDALERAWKVKPMVNEVISGTEVIKKYGEEHCRTGRPIIYTSADSVLQIAAHEDVIPLETLYHYCRQARKIMTGKHGVGRIVARPFGGTPGNYIRTSNRHDFALAAPRNLLDLLKEEKIPVMAVGKINDIFGGRGITQTVATKGNADGLQKQSDIFQNIEKGFIFTNLVDTDMLYGHRRDAEGYKRSVEYTDNELKKLASQMSEDDLLIITGDHGCDPGFKGTDHTREFTPALIFDPADLKEKDRGITDTFGCIGATVAEAFGINYDLNGRSLL